jgi:tetratricopeptide (TPR) repeat protein
VGWGIGFTAGAVAVSIGSPWAWGYYSYWNPYWVGPPPGVTYIDYSQPIVVAQPAVAAQPTAAGTATTNNNQERALALFENARALFKRSDYQMALAETNRAIALVPSDSVMHEFRALCLFATNDYQQAAAAIHAVLSTGPGWDAATLNGLYANPSVYASQLQNLEKHRDAHPEEAAPRFLLAYHYTLGGQEEKAAEELEVVVALEPKDQLAVQLLKGLTTPEQSPKEQQTAGPKLPSEPVEASSLVGSWQAVRPDGSKLELNLDKDNKFSWKVTSKEKNQQLNGTYTLANNYLILSASDEDALIGQVALETPERLKFKLAGGSPGDPGLTFTR